MHEIITLQLGQRANYLATHFWNIQESYFTYHEGEQSLVDHDVHFRAGMGADGTETFTPRTVIYDLKGGFGTLRKHNALYDLTQDGDDIRGLWDGKETVQRQPAIPQSEYQRSLDRGLPAPTLTSDTVRYWSDYNRVFYHPKSIVQLNDYELHSRTMPFEDWNVGEELFQDLDKEHDLLDRDLRPFAEECDQIRALQIFTSSDDAWGGFSARYVDRIRDEFGKKGLWIWALESGAKVQRENRLKRDINLAKSLSSIAPLSSLYVPIHDPPARIPEFLTVDRQSEWHTSALISSAIETVTLPSRLRQHHDFEAGLAGDDGVHQIFELQSRIMQDRGQHTNGVAANSEQTDAENGAVKAQTRFDLNFSHEDVSNKAEHLFNQVEVTRGSRPEDFDDEETKDPAFVRRERFYNSEPMLQRFYVPMGFPLLDSAPRHMFPVTQPDKKEMSVLAALTASSRTGDSLRALQMTAQRIISIDERETIYNSLGEIRESYETGWNSGSDSDDD